MAGILTAFCFILAIRTSTSANICLCLRSEVAAPVGGAVVLPCHLPSFANISESLQAVWWRKEGTTENIFNHEEKQSKGYKSILLLKTDGEARLRMENVTESDAGEYICWMNMSAEGLILRRKCCSIKLNVEHKLNDDLAQLLTMWALYLLSLMICLWTLYRWGSKLNQTNHLHMREAFLT